MEKVRCGPKNQHVLAARIDDKVSHSRCDGQLDPSYAV